MIKYVYLIQSLENGYYKIGISNNPNKRIKQLQTGNSSELKLIVSYKSKISNKIENIFHKKYEYLKKEGEWFELSLNEEINFITNCKNIENNLIFLKENNNAFI